MPRALRFWFTPRPWIKCRYPDVFCAAILNSQPMGFYQPAQLVRDARAHGVEIRGADVNFSDWDCTLEPGADGKHAVRLGFRHIAGLAEDEMEKLVAARGNGFSSIERLAAIAGISRFTIERLAEADAFRSLGLDRRAALWAARRLDMIGIRPAAADGSYQRRRDALPLLTPHLSDELFPEQPVELPAMPLAEHVVEDYVATGLSLKAHPVRFFPRPPRRAWRHPQWRTARRGASRRIRSSPSPVWFWCGSGRAHRKASCS